MLVKLMCIQNFIAVVKNNVKTVYQSIYNGIFELMYELMLPKIVIIHECW